MLLCRGEVMSSPKVSAGVVMIGFPNRQGPLGPINGLAQGGSITPSVLVEDLPKWFHSLGRIMRSVTLSGHRTDAQPEERARHRDRSITLVERSDS